MTTKTNVEVSSDALHRATKMAQQMKQNVVVFKSKLGKKDTEFCTAQKVWDDSEEKQDVEFLAIIDANGNYVD
jgi:hypothetical protein